MAQADNHVVLPGSERQPLPGARRVSAADPNERMTVSVRVRPRPDAAHLPGPAELGAKPLAERQHMTREEFAASYGADPGDIARVEVFASQYGLEIVESSAARRTVVLSGTVEAMSRAFAVDLGTYEHAGGTYRGRDGAVRIPRELANVVEGVFGLDNRAQARPLVRIRPRNLTSFSVPQLARLYHFPTDTNGAGQCIGIVELGGGFPAADLATFFGGLGLATPALTTVGVDGATNSPGGTADAEVELDIMTAGAVAPGASIAVYFAPNTEQGFIDAVTTAVHDTTNNPSVISISWGAPEDTGWTSAGLHGLDGAFAEAAVLGVTVLCASGDNGSNDRVGDGRAHVDFPASSANVIACGGTTLQVADDGTFLDETCWNDGFGGSTGGGVSRVFPLPSWQAALGLTSVDDGLTGRVVPDVAGDADPSTGYQVIVDGNPSAVGGTSAVAPLYAGLIALINASRGTPAGYLNPTLYGLNGGVFRDITTGNNVVSPARGYSAGPGYDACTGLGRIDGTALSNAL